MIREIITAALLLPSVTGYSNVFADDGVNHVREFKAR